jgi:hypothetical protein
VTAIAYRGGIMAADSAVRSSGTLLGTVKKIVRSPDGALGASSGCAYMGGAFDDWMRGNRKGPLELKGDTEKFSALVVLPDGTVVKYDSNGYPDRTSNEFHVGGSGWELMLGAMEMGATAERAVAVAIKYDGHCGGPIQVEHLHPALAEAAE